MQFDVAIVGGGPSGAVAAIVIAQAGYQVCILDRKTSEFRIGETLPPAARPLLHDLDLLDQFLLEGHLPCLGNISHWGSAIPDRRDFIYDPNGNGWHLNRRKFDAFLRLMAEQRGATVFRNTSCLELCCTTRGHVLKLSTECAKGELSCRFLIDATGRSSGIGRRLGAIRNSYDRLVCAYGTFSVNGSADTLDQLSCTLLEAVSDGWWYSARLPSNKRIVAFHTDADLLQARKVWDAEIFLSGLRETSLIRSAMDSQQYTLDFVPRVIPAGSARLTPAAGSNWLAVGDAACTFDPLSSQGILNALFTGMTAGKAVTDWLGAKPAALEGYGGSLRAVYEAYQANLDRFYKLERRWRLHEFWQRRY